MISLIFPRRAPSLLTPHQKRTLAHLCPAFGASLVAQKLKNLPAMWETLVRPLGQKDPLEKGMATHSSVLARRIPWTVETGGMVHGVAKSRT